MYNLHIIFLNHKSLIICHFFNLESDILNFFSRNELNSVYIKHENNYHLLILALKVLSLTQKVFRLLNEILHIDRVYI